MVKRRHRWNIGLKAFLKVLGLVVGYFVATALDLHERPIENILAFLCMLVGVMVVEWLVNGTLVDVEQAKVQEELTGLRKQVEHNEHTQNEFRSNVRGMLEGISAEAGTRKLIMKGWEYAGRTMSNMDTDRAWAELTTCACHTYKATNRMVLSVVYGNNGAENILTLQGALGKVYADMSFQKVMIVDNKQELLTGSGATAMERHRAAGEQMKVKWMLHSSIARSDLDSIGGADHMDFAVFDQEVVLVWLLNADRSPKGGQVLVGRNEAAPFLEVFEHLFKRAEPLSAVKQ